MLLADPPYVWAVADNPTVIANLRNWIVGLLAALATLFFTFGGLRYLMAGGDPGKVESAKRALKAAAIGYGLAVLAPVIVTVLQSIVGADGGGGQ
ncbi:pilin [Streptomyces sp. NPDC047009]|uniref:pilin n=1 Tax=Streptomyces sp. NPDC047009 TaxID=3154496 RepID=UPI0033F67677